MNIRNVIWLRPSFKMILSFCFTIFNTNKVKPIFFLTRKIAKVSISGFKQWL